MPKNRKTPELSDFEVRFSDDGSAVVARATSLTVHDGTVVLRDTYGAPLFAASLGAVRYVKRLEPGREETLVPLPASLKDLAPGQVRDLQDMLRRLGGHEILLPAGSEVVAQPDDPGPVETGPPSGKVTPRSSRRGK